MKVKELPNLWIKGHSKHILSVPWRDLSRENVPYGLPFSNGFGIHSKEIVIHSNGLGYLFNKSCHRFEKKVIRLNGLGYPFNHLNDWSYLFKDKFQPSFHPKTISSLATHVKQSVILQVMYITKLVYKCIIYE